MRSYLAKETRSSTLSVIAGQEQPSWMGKLVETGSKAEQTKGRYEMEDEGEGEGEMEGGRALLTQTTETPYNARNT